MNWTIKTFWRIKRDVFENLIVWAKLIITNKGPNVKMWKSSIVAWASLCNSAVDSDHHTHHDILSQSEEAELYGVRRGRRSLVVLIYGEWEDKPQSNWGSSESRMRTRGAVKEEKMRLCFCFCFMNWKKKQNLEKKRRERRWEISESYRLCRSYTLVSNGWNMLVKVKRTCHRSRSCLIMI